MKELLKDILKRLKIYHPLQLFYRTQLLTGKTIYYRIAYSKYKGSGFTCNCCNAQYSKFVPEYPEKPVERAINDNNVIAGYGEHVYCPRCFSKNRERLIIALLEHRIDISSTSILHFSPEKYLNRYLRKKAFVTTVDIEPGFYTNIDPKITFSDATNLAFADESFDMVIANHILEHIPDDSKAMKELWRVTKTGGSAILQVPYSETLATTLEDSHINDPAKQEALFGQRDHVRIYEMNNYIHRLTKAGFTVEVLRPEALKEFEMYAIQPRESVFLCKKQV